MTAFGHRYVTDTNVLSQLGPRRRANAFFKENAVIPEEVLHEASGFPDIEALQANAHSTTARTLHWLSEVMRTVPEGETRLVDLYANLGNADPLVVACALEGREHDSQWLIRPEWIVVTDDGAVRDKAKEFELEVLNNSQFAARVDAADDEL
ncbi:PIN domain-containing protein [Ornithinimicrobium faecis]|uniref:PIN domain-containing protein n=1 Tax=Ornithinimicrobium faecis TaxID=2934158 RepID=A0ABY4YTW0_9MICO|nr:PIN domain-containing protein [Ornithinimicrobium sp. HY1793]USQ79700.1 PIN domain-containing protein [Ornithinimicrobium sp. HY1793]